MSKRRILLIIKLCVTVLFFILIATNKNITIDKLKTIWLSANPLFLVLSFLIAGVCLILNIVRWHYFMKSGGLYTGPVYSVFAYLAGFVMGFITPGRLGEFGRGIFYENRSIKETALVTLADKVYFNFFILLFGILSLVLKWPLIGKLINIPVLIIMIPFLLIFLVHLFIIVQGRKTLFRGLFQYFPGAEADRFFLMTLSNIVYVLMVLQLYCVLMAFCDIKLLHAFITLSLTLVVLTFFPVAIGNLGIRETCFMVFLKSLADMPESIALSAGLIFFIQNLVMPSCLGIIAALLLLVPANAIKRK
jgi:uncharacterized membrane protein YbhN (UPF0104 family)